MKSREACKIGLAVVLCGLSLPPATCGQDEKPRQVKDEAKLFSATAIDEANAIIAKVRDKHRKDLMIETMEKGPVAKEAGKWAANRAVDQRVDGIYVVITKEPRHFEVVVSKKTQESGFFLAADRDKMVAILREYLGKDRDEALLKIARFALDTLQERAKTAKTDAPKARLVKDEAMLFSKHAVEEVNAIVTKIKEQHGKDLFIETVSEGPDKDNAAPWAAERFKVLKLDGVYLVITKKPGFFRIMVGDAEATGQAAELSPASSPVRVILKPAPMLRGVVKEGEGSAVIVWPQSTAPGDFGKAIPCGAGGNFETRGLAPGDYYALAVDRYDPREMTTAAYLRGVISHASSVRLEEGASASLELSLR